MKFKMVYLKDICEINIGKTPSRNQEEYWKNGTNKWIAIADLTKNGKYIKETKEYITDFGIKKTNIKIIPKGTNIMSFKLSIGKVAITGEDMYSNEAIVNFPIKDKMKLNRDYLYYALKILKLHENTDRAVMGATLNKAKLNLLKIPLPPIEIQIKIAEALDKAQELIDNRKLQLEKYDELIQSTFINMFGDPVTNPKKWETKSIEKFKSDSPYSIKRGPFGGALKKEIFVEKGYLVYEQYHALNNDFSFERYYITEDKFQELKSFEIEEGDIIISCSGVYLGKLAIIPKGAKKGIINQALLKLKLNNSIMCNTMFSYIFTNKNFKKKYFPSDRGSGVPNFPSMPEFKKFKFILPPIELQNKFASIVKVIENEKKLCEESLKQMEENFSSIIDKAFKGELF